MSQLYGVELIDTPVNIDVSLDKWFFASLKKELTKTGFIVDSQSHNKINIQINQLFIEPELKVNLKCEFHIIYDLDVIINRNANVNRYNYYYRMSLPGKCQGLESYENLLKFSSLEVFSDLVAKIYQEVSE